MLAVLFPGQGSERAGMGLDACARSPEARGLMEHAGALCGVDLFREVERLGPALRRTEVLQPALAAACLGLWSLFAAGITPGGVVAFAGHSLGELCAWAAAGGAAGREAVEVAALRGRAMARASREFPGWMISIAGADEGALARALAAGRARGRLSVSAHNAPDEWTLSGDEAALRAVSAVQPATRVPVSGPWHSEAMAGARDPLRAALGAVPARALAATLVANASGAVVESDAEARARMVEGVAATVQWAESLRALWALGARRFVVIGPGRAVRATVRKTLGEGARVWLAEDVAGVERALAEAVQK